MAIRRPVRELRPAATSTAEIGLLREDIAAAARGDRFLLHAELPDTPAAAGAAAELTTLAAFALSYATGLPVGTVLEVPEAATRFVAVRNRALLLAWLVHDGQGAAPDAIERVSRRMLRLSLPTHASPAEVAFLRRMRSAWAFAIASGGEPDAVRRVLRDNRFLSWPAAQGARRRFIGAEAGGEFGILAPALSHRDRVAGTQTERAAGLTNPVIIRAGPEASPGELGRLSARLAPEREPGRLVVVTTGWEDRLDALVAAVSGRPVAWVLGCAADTVSESRLRAARSVLADHGCSLAGVSVQAKGRWLERVLRTAVLLSAAVPGHDASKQGASR